MALAEVQDLFVTYIRDPMFREAYRHGDTRGLQHRLNLSPQDIALLANLNLDDMDRAAAGIREERSGKRRGEFGQFMDHLAVYGPEDSFFEGYDQAYTTGLMGRPAELDRFLAFATEFILTLQLPEYLLDLLRFCYHYTQLADAAYETSEDGLAELPATGIKAYHIVELRGPYRIVNFRYDALALAMATPSPELVMTRPKATQLFMQKDSVRAKTVQIRHVEEIPFLPQLLEGRRSVLGLLSPLPSSQYSDYVTRLVDMFQRGVVAIATPKHLL